EVHGPGISERRVRRLFENTSRTGLYSATSTRGSEPRQIRFAVTAGDAAESDLRVPAAPISAVGRAGGVGDTPERPLWPWLLVAALVVALAESVWRASGRASGAGTRRSTT
ncbi:MAG: hypothetical protein ACK2T6_04350, partial [Anaerolineae bacterium]